MADYIPSYRFEYSGTVSQFGKVISNNWMAVTYATNEKKAKNNFLYRYKKEHNMTKDCKIELTGNLRLTVETINPGNMRY